MLNINFDAAIKNNVLDFMTAAKLSKFDSIDDAIKADALDFATALKLSPLTVETVEKPAPKAPKAVEKPVETVEETAEETPVEFSHTKGGAVIQYEGHNTLKANHLKRVRNAMERLVKAGFCVSWKRIGGWIWINHAKKADGKTKAEFEAALELLPKGWEMHGSSIVDKNMLAEYADNFR